MRLPCQNALAITGGASGIGAASVQAALGRGWLVASCDVQPADKLPASLLIDEVLYVQADVRSADPAARATVHVFPANQAQWRDSGAGASAARG